MIASVVLRASLKPFMIALLITSLAQAGELKANGGENFGFEIGNGKRFLEQLQWLYGPNLIPGWDAIGNETRVEILNDSDSENAKFRVNILSPTTKKSVDADLRGEPDRPVKTASPDGMKRMVVFGSYEITFRMDGDEINVKKINAQGLTKESGFEKIDSEFEDETKLN